MKRFLVAAVAAIALLGLVGCDTPTSSGDTGTPAAAKVWKIKGSFDNWVTHNLVADETIANQWTFDTTGLYAIDYEFVLINPAGVEVKYSTDTNVTPGTPFVMGGANNVSFTATNANYKVVVDATVPATPGVNLVGSGGAALAVTNAVLADRLKIKGNAFSIGWTETAGVFDSLTNTVSWDVTVSNKNGEFGFTALEGFIKKELDVSTLTAAGNALAAAEVATTGGQKLLNPSKDSSVYTFAVVIDATKTVGTGRYMLTVTLKTVGASNWAFAPWATLYSTGTFDSFGWTGSAITITAGKGVFTITTPPAGTVEFKINKVASWDGGEVGFGGIDSTGTTVALSNVGGNIAFTADGTSSYTVTVDFTTTAYTTNGTPTVTVQ